MVFKGNFHLAHSKSGEEYSWINELDESKEELEEENKEDSES